jgi:hypothetical protein
LKMLASLLTGAKRILRTELDDIQQRSRQIRYQPSLAVTNATDRAILDALETNGSCVTTLDALGIPGSAEMLRAADELYGSLAERPPGKGGFLITATAQEIERHQALLLWGLHERLLAIVENYISQPLDYRGLIARRDVIGGDQTETRLWHRDQEDLRIVKIIVYVNDVDRGGGGYEYVDRGKLATWRLGGNTGRIDDDLMMQLVPESFQHVATGPRGTVVFTDTCSVFHRGTIAHTEDRRALFYCYNSKSPRRPHNCAPMFDRDAFALKHPELTAAQRTAIH